VRVLVARRRRSSHLHFAGEAGHGPAVDCCASCSWRSCKSGWDELDGSGVPEPRAAYVKGFGCRPGASGRPGREPASESPRRRNPRESDGCLAVYGDLARQERWQGMVFAGSLRAESR